MMENVEKLLHDMRKRELLPFKVLLFLIFGGQASIYPFLNLHLWSLNLSLEEITIILSVQPICGILVTLLIEQLVRKVKNVKAVFCFGLIFSAVCTNCLQLVPAIPQEFPEVKFRLNCNTHFHDDNFLQVSLNKSCTLKKDLPDTLSTVITFTECRVFEDGSTVPNMRAAKQKEFCFGNYSGTAEKCVPFRSSVAVNITGVLNSTSTSNGSADSVPVLKVRSASYNGDSYDRFRCSRIQKSDNRNSVCKGRARGSAHLCEIIETEVNKTKTFWFYLAIRILMTSSTAVMWTLFDVSMVTSLEKVRGDVTYQRFWGVLGVCIAGPLSGYLLDGQILSSSFLHYSSSFYMYSGIYIAATFVSVFVDFSVKKIQQPRELNFYSVFKSPEKVVLLTVIFLLGMSWGFLENFLFLFMQQNLGSSHVIIGAATAIACFSVYPIIPATGWLVAKMGSVNVIVLAFLAYALKFCGYLFTDVAAVCLPLEILAALTITLLLYGVTVYWTRLCSTSMIITVMSLWSATHFGIGSSVGVVVGGLIACHWGFKMAHLAFACLNVSTAVIFFILQFLWSSHKAKGEDNDGDSNNTDVYDKELDEVSTVSNSVSCLVFPFLWSNGMSSLSVASILRFCRRPTLAEVIWTRSGASTDDLHYYYSGSAAQRVKKKSTPTGRPVPNSRRSSVVSFRCSLAPVPEEEDPGTPERHRKESVEDPEFESQAETNSQRSQDSREGQQNVDYEQDGQC